MNICVFSDPHWSQHSSIVRSRGMIYSSRLENLLRSLNWMEELAWNTHSDLIVCCGDFFDASQLNSEEISALREISWAPIPHVFLAGNHETALSSLEFNTAELFNLCPNVTVISKAGRVLYEEGVELCFLPYVLERDRQPLETYFHSRETGYSRILFSHNDLKDVQYGQFLSTEGFTVDEIESQFDLCINGHIHHCAYVSSKIINSGNLTGQNFTEDATKFDHCVQIIHTDTMTVDFYENPHAYNFYKLDCRGSSLDEITCKIESLKPNAVITVKTDASIAPQVKEWLSTQPESKIVEFRVTV